MNETETFTIFLISHYMILQKMSIFIQNNAKISQSIKGLREPNPYELELTTASCVFINNSVQTQRGKWCSVSSCNYDL